MINGCEGHRGPRMKPRLCSVGVNFGRLLATGILGAVALTAAPSTGTALPSTFKTYCRQCHGGPAKTAGISFDELASIQSVGPAFKQWEKVASVLDDKRMPPEGMPQPSATERAEAIQWIQTSLREFTDKHAGDPGRVTVRRLTAAEYAYTVRDLTGLDLDVGLHVANDAVGGEGFMNYGDVQFMSEADLESYLAAAKKIAEHAVIGSGPLDFYTDPGQMGFELSAIHRIHDIYRKHGFRAVAAEGGRAFGLEKYASAFYAAWRYRNRDALGDSKQSLHDIAAREGLSPRFADHVWFAVNRDNPTFPTSEVVSQWRNLPAPGAPDADVRAACTEIQKFVINWPRWLFGAGDLAAGGAGDERALVITDASLVASPSADINFVRRGERGEPEAEKERGSVYYSVEYANPASTGSPVLIWRNVMVSVRGRDRANREDTPLRELLSDEEAAALRFGIHPDGQSLLGPNDFATVGKAEGTFHVQVPEGIFGFQLKATLEAEVVDSDAVLRVSLMNSKEKSGGRPGWALLADSESGGFKTWKRHVLEYAASFPQTSHGEPTPSDRDPIPAPFNPVYNQPERDRYHQRVKYFRDDDFLVENMLDDEGRVALEQAWYDVKASFEFHDAFFDFVSDKYELNAKEGGLASLTSRQIELLPTEPRGYVKDLKSDYERVQSAQQAARPRHIEDAIEFAARAWRRPLKDDEKDSLRRFYNVAREGFELDHVAAIRSMLTRILTAPAFLYRFEEPQSDSLTKLSPWEIANRLSFFLWSSLPDDELRRASNIGELETPDELKRQVKRMMSHPNARRFATEFFGQWLGFYRFDQHKGVDAKRFPDFTDDVKAAMYDEAVSFFEHIIREDRPVREIFSADYTFLNETLARHYGIEKELPADGRSLLVHNSGEFNRGGALRLGALLTATSAPLRTSPVKRGDWVLRRVLGTPTPPPPADAGSIPADEKLFDKATIKQQLEAHRRNASCVSCHTRIDPLGFPLEHFDNVGRWRESYDNGATIEDTADLSNGTAIAGIDGLLDYLRTEEPQVLKNLAYKLIGYALGRTVIASDQPLVDSLVEAGGDATIPNLVATIVSSRQFRFRRAADDRTPSFADSSLSTSPAEDE